MVKAEKDLYCPKCKEYPDVILERYLEPIVDTRKWDGEYYELVDSNISDVEYEQFCKECGTKLQFKE